MAFIQIQSDSFTRSTTAASANPGSVGNSWIDVAGSIWNIQANQLQASTSSTSGYATQILARPSSERYQDQRNLVTFPGLGQSQNAGSTVIGVACRYQSATGNHYEAVAIPSSTTAFIYKVVAGVRTQIATVACTGWDVTHSYSINLDATGNTPTTLSFTLTDTSANLVRGTVTATDSEATLQNSTGVSALSAWNISGGTITALIASVTTSYSPTGATALTLSGPTTGSTAMASTAFTVAGNGTFSGSTVVTFSATSGTFNPTSVTLSATTVSAPFTYTPSAAGTVTLTAAATGLTSATAPYTASTPAAATALSITGPSSGSVSGASSAFTVAANGSLAASVTVALSSTGSGSFTPGSVTLTTAATSGTFTYTPNAAQSVTLTATGTGLTTATAPYQSSAAGSIPTTPIVNYGAGPFTNGTTPATFIPQFGAGDALAARGIAQLKVFTDWLASGGQQGKGIVTEVAIPSSSAQFTDPNNNALFNPSWDNVLQQWYEYCNRLSVSVTPWVTSEWNIDLRGYETADGGNGPITYRSTATSVMENNLSNTVYQRGVAYAGGDYSDSGASGGVNRGHLSQPGASYYYPNPKSFPVLASRGMGCIRVPIRWERFQPTLKQALDPVEMAAFLPTLQAATANGVKILLDVHNYARYDTTPTGVNQNGVLSLGQNAPASVGGTMIDAYVDFMSRVATYFKANGGIYGYDIMNEPNALPNGNADWVAASQRAVEAIRLIDQNCVIAIEGYDFANARGWNTSNPASPWMTQLIPAGQTGAGAARNSDPKIMWNAHHYFNYTGVYGQYDGTYSGTYAAELTQAQSQGYAAWTTAGYTAPATNNTQQTGLRTTFKSDFSVDQGTYVPYVNGVNGNPNGLIVGSNVITAPFAGAGNPAPSMKIVCSSTADEGTLRQALPGSKLARIGSFDFQVDSSSSSLMSAVSTFNILHCWSDANAVDFVQVRINGSGAGYALQIAIPGTGGATATGTTVLPVGSFQTIKLVVNDTNFQLFLNGSATAEATLTSANTSKNIGGFALGKFYGSSPLTMYFDNATFGQNATYYAPPNGGLMPSLTVATTPPVVTLGSNVTSGTAPQNLTLSALVTTGTNAVASVKFYQGGSLIGTTSSTPYTLAVASLAQGTYGFTAVASDTSGVTGSSNAVSVTVAAAGGSTTVTSVPSVLLALSGTQGISPASVTLTANPSTTSGYVSLVEFFAATTKIGQSTVSPWTLAQTGLVAGSYQYSAKVTDNSGNTATSTVQTFIVAASSSTTANPPTGTLTLSLTNPTPPASLTLSVVAASTTSTVASVAFYQNGVLLNTQTVAPYSYGVAGLSAGAYSFSATISDAVGGQTVLPNQTLVITPVTYVTTTAGTTTTSSIQEVTANTQGTLIEIKNYVGDQLGRDDGNVPDAQRDRLINAARRTYYASRRWNFLLRNGFVLLLSADTLYPNLLSAPLPANRNKAFDLEAVYDTLGRPIVKHHLDQLLLATGPTTIRQGGYAIDENRGLILTNATGTASLYTDYYMIPKNAKTDGSEDLLVEPANDLTAIKYLAMSLNWMAGERNEVNFNTWQQLYEHQYKIDLRMDAQNIPPRQFRQTSRNNGYSRRGATNQNNGYQSRFY